MNDQTKRFASRFGGFALALFLAISIRGGAAPTQPVSALTTTALSPATTAISPTTLSPAPLRFRISYLANGLKVITLEDHRAPVITLQIWVRVGSADEPKGKAGFAHLFEHLMFKGSAHVKPEEHARYVEQIGGDYNANTFFDRTLFYETVPANALDRVLWLEADRFASLKVDQKNMVSERAVVEEEHRMTVENAPYGTLMERLEALLFPADHPYAHSTIGIMADLDRAVLADVRAFHARWYVPQNTTVVLTGDFHTPVALQSIGRWFGPIPRGKQLIIRIPLPAITSAGEKRAEITDKLAPLPMVVRAYRTPAGRNPDTPVLDILSRILSGGESSRLYRALVRNKQIASEVSGESLPLRRGGIFFFSAVVNAGVDPAQVEAALREQIDLLRSTPVSAAELQKAKNQALSERVFDTLSTEEKATALGEADLTYGNPAEVNQELAKLNAVTAEAVLNVANRYFDPETAVVLLIRPEAAAAATPTLEEKPQP